MTPDVVDALLFSMGERQRFTQDTPILPEVWYAYAGEPGKQHDLLITPWNTGSANRLLREMLDEYGDENLVDTVPAALRGFVAIRLDFGRFCELILPRTEWAEAVFKLGAERDFREGWLEEVLNRSIAQRRADRGSKAAFEVARIAVLVGSILTQDDDALRAADAAPSIRAGASRAEAWIRDARNTRLLTTLSQPDPGVQHSGIWRVAMNRPLDLSDTQARSTVKADAAYRVFEVECAEVTWAVIDSGIDQTHPGFNDGGTCRVEKSFDLASLRPLLNAAYRANPAANPQLAIACAAAGIELDRGAQLLGSVYRALDTDSIDWSSIEPLIQLAAPPRPIDGHGTHVAGIIGANWREDDGTPIVVGLCPDIRLYDMRILVPASGDPDEDLKQSEFAVISALQFVRYLNARNEHIAVHGVNLSLSIPHKVENYACGRTPVCDECERLVGAGVVVVAAALLLGAPRWASLLAR